MLAGAHGIDLVLFTVAADDGVMPQTEEHLDILHLLGVQHAIFVITKIDLVSESRVVEVEEEVGILIAGTLLQSSSILPFSFVTGRGLHALRAEIARMMSGIQRQPPCGYFRLPVDRAFVLQGHGLIVTGTAQSGQVRVGDRVRCLPGNQIFRVRSLQVHNQPAEEAGWGQRIALNLSGTETRAVTRGDVICDEHLTLQTDRFCGSLDVLQSAGSGIKHHQRVRVHLGTAERLARLIVLGERKRLGPKERGFCQIVVSKPLLALRGDRFIIRDETARRTLGGGSVLDPRARPHKRQESGLEEHLKTLAEGSPASLVELFLEEQEDLALPVAPLAQLLNLRTEETRGVLQAMDTVRIVDLDGEHLYTTHHKWNTLRDTALAALKDFHRTHPLAPGRDMEELRNKLPGRIPLRLFRAFVEQLEGDRRVVREANLLRLFDYQVILREDERDLVDRITALLAAKPLAPPDLQQIELELSVARAKLAEVMRVLERQQSIVRVAPDLYFLRESLDEVMQVLRAEFSGGAVITPAIVRDRFGTTRKYTIPVLVPGPRGCNREVRRRPATEIRNVRTAARNANDKRGR